MLYENFLPVISEAIPRARMPPKKPKNGKSSAGSKGKGKDECLNISIVLLCLFVLARSNGETVNEMVN